MLWLCKILRVSNFIHPLEDQSPFFRGQFTIDSAEARYHDELLKIFFGVGFRFGLWPWIVGFTLPQVLMLAPVPSPAPGKQAGDTRWETHPNRTDIRKKWTPAPGTPRDLRSAQVFRADRGSSKSVIRTFPLD